MSKGRIVLIGGDPDVTRTLCVYLSAHSFDVQAVVRGDEALAACRQSPPDAVVLSPSLPDVSGYDLCQQIRAHERGGEFFILVLLFAGDREAKLAALEAGADDVMTHPVDIEELRLRIEGALRR
jgi:DNA-binding response OmpR family regulator